ncbi:hypothetical protein [Paracoccus homiensis]|uniref:Uncharacterized protein n=1 Tax=Paracoccus homiensis TaxID=364199 RepID=A0A1I0A9H2_9RHOB|nr:hypothetical protein [Paracoccus homiensis]SES90659.1 hypothetical protein SAMN04489858_102151 [Paracoccus homiensis]
MPFPFHPGLAGAQRRVFAYDDMIARDAWSDFDAELIRFEAVVTDNNIAGSDPTLQVRAPDGTNWTIELANHARNDQVGLTQAQALPGDPVQVHGRRIHHFGENRIKATRLTIGEREFLLFPEAP